MSESAERKLMQLRDQVRGFPSIASEKPTSGLQRVIEEANSAIIAAARAAQEKQSS